MWGSKSFIAAVDLRTGVRVAAKFREAVEAGADERVSDFKKCSVFALWVRCMHRFSVTVARTTSR